MCNYLFARRLLKKLNNFFGPGPRLIWSLLLTNLTPGMWFVRFWIFFSLIIQKQRQPFSKISPISSLMSA